MPPLNIPLDSFQKDFCSEKNTAVRLLAPAGCGKTHSILWRCYFQQKMSKQPQNFLIVTFTNAAARELKQRLNTSKDFFGIKNSVKITTLNSWGYQYLRKKDRNLKLLSKTVDKIFTMQNLLKPTLDKYPSIDKAKNRNSVVLFDTIDYIKSLGFRHDKHNDFNEFFNYIVWLENHKMENHVEKILDDLVQLEIIGDYPTKKEQLKAAYDQFFIFWCEATEKLHDHSTITFEDQKYWPYIELSSKKPLPKQGGYTQILIDEFQDINVLDLNLLQEIGRINRTNLSIIGDDDQAIYEWRGASPSFIVNPDEYFGKKYQTYILKNNYRSPENIVNISQNIISNNSFRVKKEISAVRKKNAKISVINTKSLGDAIIHVCDLVKKAGKNERIAIIGRKRSQIIPYQIIFSRENIPFYAAEDLHIFLSKAFEDLQKFLLIAADAELRCRSKVAVDNLIDLCDKVKKFPLKKDDKTKLRGYLNKKRPNSVKEALDLLPDYDGPLKGPNNNRSMSLDFYERIYSLISAVTVSNAIIAISENFKGLQKDYGRAMDDIFFIDPPFLFLADFAKEYGSDFNKFEEDLQNAVDNLANISSDDEIEQQEGDIANIHLMTALRAKGREFDTVIILDVNDGVWPSKLAMTNNQLEQERRLFYVAFTRAKQHLYCIVNDSILGEKAIVSPYLSEAGLL